MRTLSQGMLLLVASLMLCHCTGIQQSVRAPAPRPGMTAPGGPAEQRPPRAVLAEADRTILTMDCGNGSMAACAELDLTRLEARLSTDTTLQTARWFQAQCVTGDSGACLQVAIALQDDGAVSDDLRRAVTAFTEHCAGQFAAGCTLAGRLLQEGRVVAGDPDRARAVLLTACDARQPDACLQLARIAKIHKTAWQLYRRACVLGSSAACVEGREFVARTGLRVDLREMSRDLERACFNGVGAACLQAASIAGWKGGAAEFLQAGCHSGDTASCLELAKALDRGTPGHEDKPRAQALYQRACALGAKEACAMQRPSAEEASSR